ncbi:hypothetical protein ACRALDRAFT_1064810 [Sodiomyces alcalophilus JCM 7366]|uniref:uncharacterized protein n=1 Tax=Sodiomyces alcalophilus JCM 7366 TaxID=591952 RepID=UPI0039B5257F
MPGIMQDGHHHHTSLPPRPHSPQPLLPLTNEWILPSQPLEDSPAPVIGIQLRQDILHRTADGRLAQSHVELAQELVNPTSAVRISHPIHFKRLGDPLIIEACAQSTYAETRVYPRIGIGLRKSVRYGVISANVDSGDSRTSADYVCDAWTDFSRQHMGPFRKLVPRSTPSLSITWTTENDGLAHNHAMSGPDVKRSRWGLRGAKQQTCRIGDGSWSLSAALTTASLAGALRYSHPLPRSTLPGRFEAELVSHASLGCYFVYRSLWAVGAHSQLGVELGVSAHAVHLSLCWSRLRHRTSLPILLSQNATMLIPPRFLFWASAIPFVVVPGLRLLATRWTASGSAARRREWTAEARQRYIAKKRTEADEVALLLSGPVEVEQRQRRDKGSLVILSAKYGVKDTTTHDGSGAAGNLWDTEEVADVTVAVAALVNEEDRLVIPQGVRKYGLLGFWDPVPGKVKWLHVRYSYRGREYTVEVRGRDGLVLPPPDVEETL